MQRTIAIIGRHARPFAENAHAHGWRVFAADGFNDWDAARFAAPLTPGGFGETPEAFLRAWETAPEPLLFCAPIEAAPAMLAEAARNKRVLNAPAHAVAAARDISFLQKVACNGVRFPAVSFLSIPSHPPETPWIIKSAKSAGGTGIRPGDGILGRDEYRQKVVHGESIGALFFSAAGRCVFLGASLHINHGFLYGGGIFPAPLNPDVAHILEQFGARVTAESGMAGWWGADFILNDEALWLLEINPRPTATAALFGKLRGVDLVAAQMAPDVFSPLPQNSGPGVMGNMVLYAEDDFTFRGSAEWFEKNARDIPHEGRAMKKGEPVLTLHATAATAPECRAALEKEALAARAAFFPGRSPFLIKATYF
ncbi:MAG: ATP-grasp domain-containing protein [Nitrospinae bacterium]|nr:ATP-grasp domain-containing protein [Nitrospinota bacterium]